MEKSVYGYRVVVMGTGAVYNEKLNGSLNILGPREKGIVSDINHGRILSAQNQNRIRASVTHPPFSLWNLSTEVRSSYIALVATPNHLEAITALVDVGFQKFIVEKPLVNNKQEIGGLQSLLDDHSDLRVYPLDFYAQKTAPLHLLAGAISPEDLRWKWIEDADGNSVNPELYGAMEKYIGKIEGIEITIIEGGSFGVQDLDKRKWLEDDQNRGGMLLDLGTHALVPIFVAKIGDAKNITVETASRYTLGKDRESFVIAGINQQEVFADSLLSLRKNGRTIPIKLTVGKTFQDGGVWKLTIRGDKGDVSMGLRSGQHLTIQPNEGPDFQLSLKKGSDPYALAFREAHMLFSNMIKQDDVLRPMLDAIVVIDKIKQAANKTK